MTCAMVVNADDFGYAPHVSLGIVRACDRGIVTATGVMTNGDSFAEDASMLSGRSDIDIGVHLTLSSGRPLLQSTAVAFGRAGLARADNPKGRVAMAVLLGRLPVAVVESEWRAQIDRAREAGLVPVFLNSHEHLHMLPSLFALTVRLCREHRIDAVRRTTPDPLRLGRRSGAGRSLALAALSLGRTAPPDMVVPRLLGVAPSGRLDRAWLLRAIEWLARTRPGSVELMCHPGLAPPAGSSSRRLLRYHDWSGETNALCAPEWRDRLAEANVNLVRYGDLEKSGT